MFNTGSGHTPPSRRYSSRSFMNRWPRILPSCQASPGGAAPAQCHCSQRLELTIEPFSSAKQLEGRRKTSVWMAAGSTSLDSPWFCQKLDVSVASGSMITRNLSLAKASAALFLSGKAAIGLKPWAM
ncbi:hypothetical protein D3C80_1495900 [compost metagenome]